MDNNPFVVYGYVSDDLFCDREQETEELYRSLRNGRNVSLIAPRRIGKSGLIDHLFHQREVRDNYNTFHIDIYATKNINEFVLAMGKDILASLQPRGKKVMNTFISYLSSLRPGLSFDETGTPSFNISVGEVRAPETTIDEIFRYLEYADRPNLVAIDEFQTIANYPENTTEALLRTHIQRCHNANFIFAGSQRSMMAEMFLSAARPFYQSATTMNINAIAKEKYIPFASRLFSREKRRIDEGVVETVYDRFEGITWYLQRVMNELYDMTGKGETCTVSMVDVAVDHILRLNEFNYRSMLFQLPARQKELLVAIAHAGKAKSMLSQKFLKQYRLPSASFVQSAIKGLLEKEFVTETFGVFEVYDKFFALWLRRNM